MFLVAILFQAIALMITIVMRVRHPYEDDVDDYSENQSAQSAMAQIQMENLKHSVLRGSAKSSTPATSSTASDNNFYTSSSKLYKK